MNTVLVVDDMAIFREPIAAFLRAAGFSPSCAADGDEAIAAMRKSPPDVLLLDLSMPKTDGLAVLRSMRADGRLAGVPVILLTAVSDKRVILEAAKLGVRDYLLKSRFSSSELVARINQQLARVAGAAGGAASDPSVVRTPVDTAVAAPVVQVDPEYRPARLLSREESLDRAEAAFDMKTMPGVVMEVIAQAASPRTDSASLAALIGRDSMLAAKVLQAANSAAYMSNRGMVATLPEAVKNIGCGTVRNVAASLGIFEVMAGQTDESFSPVRCWQHSLAVAVLCERLAGLSDLCPPSVAYLVGLCHDLGEILFRTAFAAEYRQVMDAQQKTGMRREAVERVMLGVSHNEVVSIILRKLGLPDSIRKPIEAMSSPSGRSADPAARILSLANGYANGLMLCESPTARVAPLTTAEVRAATGTDQVPVPDAPCFRGEIVALTAILARLSASQERELTKPLLSPSGKKVWMVRERGLSTFDPLEALLSAVAEVRVEARAPTPEEAEVMDRVVVVARTTSAPGAGLEEVKNILKLKGAQDVLWLAGKEDLPVPEKVAARPRAWSVTLRDVEGFVVGS
jgi:HD-like signal output (HDOD) protein/DNA-binding response OmpR family regulator